MIKKQIVSDLKNIDHLANAIQQTNEYFLNRLQKQVNTALTLRNWIIGYHIVEYEQLGEDRAEYGKMMLETLASRLKGKGIKGMAETNLKLFRQFYTTYPQIRQTLSDEFKPADLQQIKISQTVSDKSIYQNPDTIKKGIEEAANTQSSLLVNNLSFSHFIEFLKSDSATKRRFYEIQAIKNNWSVRDLKRAINSLLFERTGLSANKEPVLKKFNKEIE